MTLLYFIDIAGTFVFAISGAIAAVDKKYDVFGAMVLAFVTAVGGGTIRDVLLGSTPVGWMQNEVYLYVILSAVAVGLLFRTFILRMRRTLFLFDSIGIGLFTILGLQKALTFGVSPIVAILMGTVSAVFGGVVRDVLSNQDPLIFQKEIYATACIAGGVIFFLTEQFIGTDVAIVLTILIIICIRILAVKHNWELPATRNKS